MKLKEIKQVPIEDILMYEIHSSWWASYFPCFHEFISKWYADKTIRKYGRYVASLDQRKRVSQRYESTPKS